MSIFLLLFFFLQHVSSNTTRDASAYFIFGIFISIYFFHDLCHAILKECIYIYIYILCYMGVQICGNINAENKMRI